MFLSFCWFWWFQVPLGTSIWRFGEVSRHHFEGFWEYWKIIGISLNSTIWLAGPRIQSTWSGGGKKVDSRGQKPAINKTSKQPTCKYGVFQYCNLQDLKFRKDFKLTLCKLGSFERNGRLQIVSLEKICFTAWWPPRRPADMEQMCAHLTYIANSALCGSDLGMFEHVMDQTECRSYILEIKSLLQAHSPQVME